MKNLRRYSVMGCIDASDVTMSEFFKANEDTISKYITWEQFEDLVSYFVCGFSSAIYKKKEARMKELTTHFNKTKEFLSFDVEMECGIILNMQVNYHDEPYIFKILSISAK